MTTQLHSSSLRLSVSKAQDFQPRAQLFSASSRPQHRLRTSSCQGSMCRNLVQTHSSEKTDLKRALCQFPRAFYSPGWPQIRYVARMTLNFSARLIEPHPPLPPPMFGVGEADRKQRMALTLRLSFSHSGAAVSSATPLGPTDPDHMCCQAGGGGGDFLLSSQQEKEWDMREEATS